mmetsp:Transcript_15929/g.29146  ORF Transcript_15929/g.29146 Transcript_15929/m.29146 type:complete len:183 (-) Transcript_15929:9400-9948(-)
MDFLGLLRSIMPNSTSISCVKKPLRSFTEEEARALVLFPQLSELTLTKASLTDILLFPLLPNLRILNLSQNSLREGFEVLARLPALVSLNLNNNKIESLDALKVLRTSDSLETLYILGNPVMEIPQEVLRCDLFMTIETLTNLNGLDEAGDEAESDSEGSAYEPDAERKKPIKRARSRSPRT